MSPPSISSGSLHSKTRGAVEGLGAVSADFIAHPSTFRRGDGESREMASWSAASTFHREDFLRRSTDSSRFLSIQTSSSGGISETDVNALAVSRDLARARIEVITVTRSQNDPSRADHSSQLPSVTISARGCYQTILQIVNTSR